MFTDNVFLMGYMGCGKTTIGKKLAKLLNYAFVDLDKIVEKNENRTIAQIFEQEGESAMRIMEQKALLSSLKQNKTVIALGGGTPCFFDNIDIIKKNGISVYLKMSLLMLSDRLVMAKIERPLLKNKNKAEIIEFVEKQLKEREVFYNKANIIFDAKNLNINTLKEKIMNYSS